MPNEKKCLKSNVQICKKWCPAAARGEFSPQLFGTTALKVILAFTCWPQVVDYENWALVETKCLFIKWKIIRITWYHHGKRDRGRCWDIDKNNINHSKTCLCYMVAKTNEKNSNWALVYKNWALVTAKCSLLKNMFIQTTWHHPLESDRGRCWGGAGIPIKTI